MIKQIMLCVLFGAYGVYAADTDTSRTFYTSDFPSSAIEVKLGDIITIGKDTYTFEKTVSGLMYYNLICSTLNKYHVLSKPKIKRSRLVVQKQAEHEEKEEKEKGIFLVHDDKKNELLVSFADLKKNGESHFRAVTSGILSNLLLIKCGESKKKTSRIVLFDMKKKQMRAQFLSESYSRIGQFGFSSDGDYAFAFNRDTKCVLTWDLKKMHEIMNAPHLAEVIRLKNRYKKELQEKKP